MADSRPGEFRTDISGQGVWRDDNLAIKLIYMLRDTYTIPRGNRGAMATKTKQKSSSVPRSAITGRFVKKSPVTRHPNTTVSQTNSLRKKKNGS